jgi:hypothetical protein
MNKKLLICGAIATGLLLTACVKKEAPKEEEQEQVEVAASEPTASVPTQLEPVEEQPVVEEPTQQQVEVIREETPNTTTEIRREPTHLQKLLLQKQKRLKAAEKPAQAAQPKQNSGSAQSEDDAVLLPLLLQHQL